MNESLDEFTAVVKEAITNWSGGKVINIVKSGEVTESDLALIRQRIYTRGKDESLADAKSAAQEILDEDGKIKKEIKVQSPDVPFVRKGDLVYVISELAQSYYGGGQNFIADKTICGITVQVKSIYKITKIRPGKLTKCA